MDGVVECVVNRALLVVRKQPDQDAVLVPAAAFRGGEIAGRGRAIGIERFLECADRENAVGVEVVVRRERQLLEVVDALGLRAASRTDCTAGSKSEMRTAMIAITTSSSMSVKPVLDLLRIEGVFIKIPPQSFAVCRMNVDVESMMPATGSEPGGLGSRSGGRNQIHVMM